MKASEICEAMEHGINVYIAYSNDVGFYFDVECTILKVESDLLSCSAELELLERDLDVKINVSGDGIFKTKKEAMDEAIRLSDIFIREIKKHINLIITNRNNILV